MRAAIFIMGTGAPQLQTLCFIRRNGVGVTRSPFLILRSLFSTTFLAMSNSTVRGIVHLIEETKSFGQKGFRKRLVVLEQANGRFTNYIPLEFTNDACESADALNVGDDVTITYRLTGRKWQRDPMSEVKYFLTAEAMGFRKSAAGDDDVSSANDELSESSADFGDAPF